MPPSPLSSQPPISVVMPVYNRPQQCVEAIESILSQSFGDFEFLIVNDGSTDDTGEVLDGFARRDGRIRVLHQPRNQGVAVSLNIGIAESRGGLIARMDSDDWALPHRLERQLAFMERNPRIGAAGCAVKIVNEMNGLTMIHRFPARQRLLREALLRDCVFIHPTMIMRRDVVVKLGGYRRAFESAEDYDLWLRLDELTGMTNMPDVLMQYRIHTAMASREHHLRQRYRALVARFAARRRRRGETDLFGANRIYDDETMEELLALSQQEKTEFWLEKFKIQASRDKFTLTASHTNHFVPLDRFHMSSAGG